MGVDETATLDRLIELVIGVHRLRTALHPVLCSLEQTVLNRLEERRNPFSYTFTGDDLLLPCIPSCDLQIVVLDIPGADRNAERDAFCFMLGKFPAALVVLDRKSTRLNSSHVA